MGDSEIPHEHPSPHRTRIGAAALLFALAIGPAAWAFQQMLSYGVTSHVCFPSDAPVAPPPVAWSGLWLQLMAAGMALLILPLGGAWSAWGAWQAPRDEKGGASGALLDIGEGRSRFLAACGLLTGSLFSLAIICDLAVALALRSCQSLAS